ncbi:MAG: hypothetical protein AVDCRST_MAG73-375 [uncultured Thermomicrobiales bacterium]|uniref:Uncharacterized protein n=1 Tax=uncultured Thermomicrobiales bacterium TaxID=1645740 RepID=A0A6J4TIM4_9BACT|nr:MAG: hypothetical protein AVDCRST_MAG73-375 [uncultured Thermomicrobiales bacterium]
MPAGGATPRLRRVALAPGAPPVPPGVLPYTVTLATDAAGTLGASFVVGRGSASPPRNVGDTTENVSVPTVEQGSPAATTPTR